MSEKKKNALPSRVWNVPAAICALLLTVILFVTQAGLLACHIMTSSGLHERVALDKASVDTQMERIYAAMDGLAEEYGFLSEPVKAAISREQVEELNRQAVEWWTGILKTGKVSELPSYLPSLEEPLKADEGFVSSLNPLAVNSTILSIEMRVSEAGRKSAILYRDQILNALIHRAEGSVNLPEIVEVIQKLPMLGGLAGLLLMGLIALMMSRKIQTAGQYIGGAFSACGLLMVFTLILTKMMNLRGMIGEASEALMVQYVHLSRILTLEILGGAVLLMILGGLAMAWAERTRRKDT